MAKVDLRRIALEAQVSVTLASQVLNNRDVRVAPETRERILAVAERYKYVPNRLASGLKLKRTNTIAVFVPFTSVGFFSELIFHIEAYAVDRGFNTLVINTFGDREKEEKALGLYRSGMMDGFLVAPQDVASHRVLFGQIQAENFPFVFIDRYVEGVEAAIVSSDHSRIAEELTRSLIGEGHERILFARRLNEAENSTIRCRMESYARTMEAGGLEPAFLGFSFDGERSDLAERLGELIAAGRGPSAIFLASGFYMPQLLRSLASLGGDADKIDLATVDGFMLPSDFLREKAFAQGLGENLRVAVQDTQAIARLAVDRLIGIIGGDASPRGPEYVPVEWRRI